MLLVVFGVVRLQRTLNRTVVYNVLWYFFEFVPIKNIYIDIDFSPKVLAGDKNRKKQFFFVWKQQHNYWTNKPINVNVDTDANKSINNL